MPRRTESFARGGSKFKQQPSVLVVCEDSKSSKTYVNDLRKRFTVPNVKVDHFGDTSPTKIVNEAIKRGKSFDYIYCVLDADVFESEGFDPVASIPSPQRSRLVVIASSPCFEYWLLLHFKKTRKSFTSKSVINMLCKEPEMSGYTKGGIHEYLDELFDKLNFAVANAASVRHQNEQDGSGSPMTNMDILVASFKLLAAPQPIN